MLPAVEIVLLLPYRRGMTATAVHLTKLPCRTPSQTIWCLPGAAGKVRTERRNPIVFIQQEEKRQSCNSHIELTYIPVAAFTNLCSTQEEVADSSICIKETKVKFLSVKFADQQGKNISKSLRWPLFQKSVVTGFPSLCSGKAEVKEGAAKGRKSWEEPCKGVVNFP